MNRQLTERDFVLQPNVPAALTEVGSVEVPYNEVWLFEPSKIVELFTTARYEDAGMIDPLNSPQTVIVPWPIVDNSMLRPEDGGTVIAYGRTAGGVVYRLPITAINYNTGEVTLDTSGGTAGDDLLLWALLGAGQLQVQARPPVGSTTVASVLLSRRIRSLNISNPFSNEEAPRLDKLAVLPAGFRLSIWVNAPVVIDVADAPGAQNDISSWKIPYRMAPRANFGADLERRAIESLLMGR